MNFLSKEIARIYNRVSFFLANQQKDKLKVEASWNAAGSLTVKMIGMGLSLLLQVILARTLGIEKFGNYTYVLAWIIILTLFGKLGFDVSAIRFVADYKAKQEWGLLSGFLQYTRRIVLVLSVITTLIFGCSIVFLYVNQAIERHLAFLFLVALPLLPVSSVLDVQIGILRGMGQVVTSLVLQVILFPVITVVAITLYIGLAPAPLTDSAVIIIHLCATVAVVALQQFYIRRGLRVFSKEVRPSFANSEWFSATTSMSLTAAGQTLIRRLDVLIIGSVLGTSATGIYEVAVRLVRLVRLGLLVANLASAHLFARLYGQDRRHELQQMVFLTAKWTFLSTFPIIVVLFFWADDIMFLFGRAFLVGLPVLQILLLGELFNVFTGPNALLMDMMGRHREMARILWFTLVIDVCLLWVLVIHRGVVGAAIATSVVVIISNVITVISVWQYFRINSTVFSLNAWR